MAAGSRRWRGWQPCTRYGAVVVGTGAGGRLAPAERAQLPQGRTAPPSSNRPGPVTLLFLVAMQAAKLLYESRDQ